LLEGQDQTLSQLRLPPPRTVTVTTNLSFASPGLVPRLAGSQ